MRAEVVIIGAGPAGIATAIQLKRYNIEPELIEQEEVGGLLRNASLVENYPGFPGGISGLKLVNLFAEQLRTSGIQVHFEKVLALDYAGEVFLAKTNRREIASRIVVIASGTKPKRMNSPPIPNDVERRLFYEIYPLLETRNKKIAIIGAGDAAFDYACSLSQKNEVVILNRRNRTKCTAALHERCLRSGNIRYLCDLKILEMAYAAGKVSLRCAQNHASEEIRIEADHVVAAIGREACLDFMCPELQRISLSLRRSYRLYLVGDVRNGIYRQTGICVGNGLRAAMEIHRHIGNHAP